MCVCVCVGGGGGGGGGYMCGLVLVSKSAIKEVGFRGAIMKGQWVRVRVRVG